MLQAATVENSQEDQLEEAKNIALGWRIVGQVEPQSLEEAKDMLQSSAEYAARVYDILYQVLRDREG
ncbi:hypothetical protein BL250_16030 [Erwinia sp. OLTSP20]|uniref:hypothetical protein n=1 Tax=unclassified Erwinia TaxID=2622719 RepID=UPI000C1939FB|nr:MULTISPECIES: hypothetical protein [unclassified Erwinia]PIJ49226.1 hypothetical protein BV501_13525 [Erwinia sp. OAMSP11]PIJ70508.1 hypothetical protein BK416_13165 [Erwinia sp. OLSSP12]PIJ78742.1 hypothetical protein BLD47_16935 [Erwinia sp. OLCASP19]PIJ81235.1 hypothetical protein BLD46_12930 [Erwinia sp. OLMTSP26]PIJ84484.1 hypothetical protein BLD49_12135 [Erwinia sp. OLMDSP33]